MSQHGSPGKGGRPRVHNGDRKQGVNGDIGRRQDWAACDPKTWLAGGRQQVADPTERSHSLNACGHQGGKEVGEPSPRSTCLHCTTRGWRGIPRHGSSRPKRASAGWRRRGYPPTQQHAQTALGQGSKGATPIRQRALPVHSQGGRGGGGPPRIAARAPHAHAGKRVGHPTRAAY